MVGIGALAYSHQMSEFIQGRNRSGQQSRITARRMQSGTSREGA